MGVRIKRGWKRRARMLWYLAASMLLLSLPIFSDWNPSRYGFVPFLPGDNAQRPEMHSISDGRLAANRTGLPGGLFSPAANRSAAPALSTEKTAQSGENPQVGKTSSHFPASSEAAGGPPLHARSTHRSGSFRTAGGAFRPLPPPERVGAGLETDLFAELDRFQQEYQITLDSLFSDQGESAFLVDLNPFQAALDTQPSELKSPATAGAPASGNPSDTADPIPPPPASNSDSLLPPGQSSGGAEPGVRERPGLRFSFFLFGDFALEAPGERIFRAAQDESGAFILENNVRITIFSGLLGVPRAQLDVNLSQQEQLYLADFDLDGLPDFIRIRRELYGSLVESFHRSAANSFQSQAALYLPYQSIRAAGLYDVTGDGRPELVLALEGIGRLTFYQFQGREFRYLKDLVVPFQPGLLFTERRGTGLSVEDRLYIVDRELNRVVYLSSRLRGNVLVPSGWPAHQQKIVELESNEAGQSSPIPEILAIEVSNRLILVQPTAGDIRMLGNFEIEPKVPIVLVGDLLHDGMQRLVLLP